jgi:hypothetical protein
MRFALVILLAISVLGCERAIVEGRTTDAHGEALPGVVVRIDGTSHQDLTDGVGRYRLAVYRGADSVRLRFSKSGYAPAETPVSLDNRLRIEAPETALWLLPLNPGVFTLRNAKYLGVDWVLPKEYTLKEGGSEYGVELPEALRVESTADNLWLVCYRTPRYNARLSRLAPADATVPGVSEETVPVWVESGSIPVGLEAVDSMEGHLLRVVFDRLLEPGVYALHWGAIEGYTTLEQRAYVFRVIEPRDPEPEESEAESEAGDAPADAADGEGTRAIPDAVEPPADEAPAPADP